MPTLSHIYSTFKQSLQGSLGNAIVPVKANIQTGAACDRPPLPTTSVMPAQAGIHGKLKADRLPSPTKR